MQYMYNDLMKNLFSHSVCSFTTKMQNKGDLKLKILDNIYKYHIKIHIKILNLKKKKTYPWAYLLQNWTDYSKPERCTYEAGQIGLLERCDGYVQCSAICRQMKCIFVQHLMCSANVLYCINEVEI